MTVIRRRVGDWTANHTVTLTNARPWRSVLKFNLEQQRSDLALNSMREIRNLNDSAYHLLRRAWQFAADVYAEEIGDGELTHRQFTLLLAVEQNEGATQTDLIAFTGIDRSTLSGLVKRLSQRGYLLSKRAKSDSRANAIRLSASGRRALQAVQPLAAKADRQLLGVLPSAERREFLTALGIISEALDRRMKTSGHSVSKRPARRGGAH